jgi:hypothetical protein
MNRFGRWEAAGLSLCSRRVALTLFAVVSLVHMGCESVEVFGPTWLVNGQTATYTLDMEPYYSHTGATVYVVVQVPDPWTPLDWTYSGTIDGLPVTGAGLWNTGDPGNCSKPAQPAGTQRVWAEAGVFADLEPGRDHVAAELNFNVGVAPGDHVLEFWYEVVDDVGATCSTPTWHTLDVHQWRQPEWVQVIGSSSPVSPGLGGVPGGHWGRAVFEGFLYTVVEPDDENTEIWRTANFIDWELVRPAVANENAYDLFVFQDRLMMLAIHDQGGPNPIRFELWVSDDGLDWVLSTIWTDTPNDVFHTTDVLGVLLRRGDPPDYEFFLMTSDDGWSWTTVGGGPFVASPEGAACGVAINDEFFIGGVAEDGAPGNSVPQLWRYDGAVIAPVDTSPMWGGDSRYVTSMAVHDGALVVGTRADLGGEVWTFDGVGSWRQIGDHGLGLPGDGFVRDLVSHLGSLFALIVRYDDSQAQIWYADHNLAWSKSDLDSYTSNSFVVRPSDEEGELYVASRHELWRRVLLFEDGFETQDTTRWTAAATDER